MVQFINMPGYQPSPLLDLSPIAQGLQMRQKAQQAEAQRAMAERQMPGNVSQPALLPTVKRMTVARVP